MEYNGIPVFHMDRSLQPCIAPKQLSRSSIFLIAAPMPLRLYDMPT